jgi:SIR2-like domain/Domain of unknown function (DUF4020)
MQKMRIGQVDFPREVLDAQRDGKLVIFAGAGVSKGDPANCLTFWELAEKIGERSVTEEESKELDSYLGRLKEQGVRVHEQACRILGESLKPNPLHKELLRLFPSPDKVRLVTTNFDPHFSTAAKEVFPGKEVNTFYAPALPLGNDFEGIVYLHGSINQHPDRLVLTDSDFGKAYLTEGWATNFLKTLFSHYTVLFVGYSHEDTVVSYLARGLRPNNSLQRFALVRDKDAEKRVQNWAHLGITVLTFPTIPEDTYSALENSIKKWADIAKMGFLDREEKIRRIVEALPPIDLEEVSFIEQALKDPNDIQFFVHNAKSLEWLHWVNNRNLLKPIFEIGPPLGEIEHPLAWWFITKYILEYPQEALSIACQNGQRLNQKTWQLLCLYLENALQPSAQIQLDPQLLAQWIALLLKAPQPLDQSVMLGGLLCKCRCPEDKQIALLLFNHLTQPELNLHQAEENSAIPSIYFEITSDQTNEYWLNESWQRYFSPHLGEFARDLLPLLTSRLQQYYQLLVSVGKARSDYDPLSFGLPIVEIHEPDGNHNIHHLLTNAARQVYDYLALNHQDQSTALIESWYTSGIPILKRLAVYGVGANTQMTVNQKINWLLKCDVLYNSQFKYEVRFVLEKAYPTASAPTHHRLLKEVEKGPPLEGHEVQDKRLHYKIYDLLIWLNHISPDCILTAQKLERVKQENPEFQPRNSYESNHWPIIANDVIDRPILTVEQLLEFQPEDFLPLWQTYNPELQLGEIGFEISHYPVSEAVVVSPDWGIQLAGVLHERSDWASLLWKDLLSGWQQATLNEFQWKKIFNLLISHGEITEITRQLANLLDNSLEKITGALPPDIEDIAQQLSVRVWNRCDESEETPSGDIDDYYIKATNHPAGKITLFWLRLIARQREHLGQKWTGLLPEIAECLDKVCLGSSWAAQLSRVILVSQLIFLFGADEVWTRSTVLPLLSWQEDKLRARQAWHAFLHQTHWNDALFPNLLPLFEQAFSHTDDIRNKGLRSRFSEVLAYIALYETDEATNPIDQGWLKHFVKTVPSQDRRNWAFHIANHLKIKKLSAEAVVEAWNRWMREYWQQRVRGIPRPLDDNEYAEMLKWLVPLEKVILVQEILPLIENDTQSHTMASFWYTFLDVRPRPENMEEWSKLILYLLKHSTSTEFSNFCCNKMDSLITYLKQEPKTIETLRQVCDELGRLGCSNAGELRQSLDLP